jgi:hypothetical protein
VYFAVNRSLVAVEIRGPHFDQSLNEKQKIKLIFYGRRGAAHMAM